MLRTKLITAISVCLIVVLFSVVGLSCFGFMADITTY